jgi:hypothetical protein
MAGPPAGPALPAKPASHTGRVRRTEAYDVPKRAAYRSVRRTEAYDVPLHGRWRRNPSVTWTRKSGMALARCNRIIRNLTL